MTKQPVPAVDGWFTTQDEPRLLAQQCDTCGTKVFPPTAVMCPAPSCSSDSLDQVALARTGRIWSYATSYYPAPDPYVAPDPFVPYTVAAVEVADDGLIVLGHLPSDVDPSAIQIGDAVVLDIGVLFEDEHHQYLIWKWKPAEVD